VDKALDQAHEWVSKAVEVPNSVFVPSIYTYSEWDPETGQIVTKEAPTMVVDRSRLPASARGFTRYSFIEFHWRSPELEALFGPSITSVDQIDDVKALFQKNRLLHWIDSRRGQLMVEYKHDVGIQLNRYQDWTSKVSFLVVVLEDDDGYVRAYSYFTPEDFQRIRTD
jgi:hypothetical protein